MTKLSYDDLNFTSNQLFLAHEIHFLTLETSFMFKDVRLKALFETFYTRLKKKIEITQLEKVRFIKVNEL